MKVSDLLLRIRKKIDDDSVDNGNIYFNDYELALFLTDAIRDLNNKLQFYKKNYYYTCVDGYRYYDLPSDFIMYHRLYDCINNYDIRYNDEDVYLNNRRFNASSVGTFESFYVDENMNSLVLKNVSRKMNGGITFNVVSSQVVSGYVVSISVDDSSNHIGVVKYIRVYDNNNQIAYAEVDKIESLTGGIKKLNLAGFNINKNLNFNQSNLVSVEIVDYLLVYFANPDDLYFFDKRETASINYNSTALTTTLDLSYFKIGDGIVIEDTTRIITGINHNTGVITINEPFSDFENFDNVHFAIVYLNRDVNYLLEFTEIVIDYSVYLAYHKINYSLAVNKLNEVMQKMRLIEKDFAYENVRKLNDVSNIFLKKLY